MVYWAGLIVFTVLAGISTHYGGMLVHGRGFPAGIIREAEEIIPDELPDYANRECPVMPGEKAVPEFFVEYAGKRIYLCCKPCLRIAGENPGKWNEKV